MIELRARVSTKTYMAAETLMEELDINKSELVRLGVELVMREYQSNNITKDNIASLTGKESEKDAIMRELKEIKAMLKEMKEG